MSILTQEALNYAMSGISIIPANKDKRPALKEWTPYMQDIANPKQIQAMFGNGRKYLAAIGGRVSGNLEIIDFDCQGEAFGPWCELIEQENPDLFKRLPLEESPSGGGHAAIRCPEVTIPGNRKLAIKKIEVTGPGKHSYGGKEHEARKVDGKWYITPALVETRGERGYCLIYPSQGYQLRQGDFCNIPTVTQKEYKFLIDTARSFNEWVETNNVVRSHEQKQAKPIISTGKLPGEDFDERGEVRSLLLNRGWTKVADATFQGSPVERYRRPGKDRGWSASLIEEKIFYCFTSNAPPFEPEKAYSPFAVYAMLEHSGDFTEAAKALAKQGYGTAFNEAIPKTETKSAHKQTPKGRKLDELKKMFSAEVFWVWREHFPKGLPVIVNGREGCGKTTLCIQAGKEITEQHPNGTVVWLASEGAVQDTVSKMDEIGVSDRFVVAEKGDGTFKWNFINRHDLKELEALLGSLPQPILAVFVDSLRGITPYDDNESKIKNVMQAVNAIVCDKFKASLIYIHHFSKGQKATLLDQSTGTTAITSSVRVVLSVLPVSAFKRTIKQAKSNLSGNRPELDVVKIGNRVIINEPIQASEDTTATQAEEFLLKLFETQPRIAAKEIYDKGEKAGFSSTLLKNVKKTLGIETTKDGFEGSWYWECPLYKGKRDSSELSKKTKPVTTCNYMKGHEGSHDFEENQIEAEGSRRVRRVTKSPSKNNCDSSIDNNNNNNLSTLPENTPRELVGKIDTRLAQEIYGSD